MSKFKTVYVLSEVERIESGYTHRLLGIYMTFNKALEEKSNLEYDDEHRTYTIEPWPLEH